MKLHNRVLESGGEGFEDVGANRMPASHSTSVKKYIPLRSYSAVLFLPFSFLLQTTQQTTKSQLQNSQKSTHTHSIPPYRRNHVSGIRCGVNPAGGLRDSCMPSQHWPQPNETFNRPSTIFILRLLLSIAVEPSEFHQYEVRSRSSVF